MIWVQCIGLIHKKHSLSILELQLVGTQTAAFKHGYMCYVHMNPAFKENKNNITGSQNGKTSKRLFHVSMFTFYACNLIKLYISFTCAICYPHLLCS